MPLELLPLPAQLPARYGVLGVRTRNVAPDVLKIYHVRSASPALRAGLRAGDRILGVLPYGVKTSEELSRSIQSFAPGTAVELLIERQGKEQLIEAVLGDVRGLYPIMGERGQTPGGRRAARHEKWGAHADPLERRATELIAANQIADEVQKLESALQFETERYGGDTRLQDVHYGLRHPLKIAQLADDLSADFSGSNALATHLLRAAAHLDIEAQTDFPVAVAVLQQWALQFAPNQPLYEHLVAPFLIAGLLAQQALADLAPEHRTELSNRIPALLDHFVTHRTLDESTADISSHVRVIQLAKQVELAPLIAAAAKLAQFGDGPALKKLRRLARQLDPVNSPLPHAFEGRFRLAQNTPWGWILIGDDGPNVYGADAAMIIDLGGDDIYLNNCASPSSAPVGLIVDFAGDDRYVGNRLGAGGAAMGGIGLLLDLKGDDIYQGDRVSQGAAFCGVAALWDRRGNDAYIAQEVAQGAAFFGVGIVLDERGDDLYSATLISQGFGGTSGFGLLADGGGRGSLPGHGKMAFFVRCYRRLRQLVSGGRLRLSRLEFGRDRALARRRGGRCLPGGQLRPGHGVFLWSRPPGRPRRRRRLQRQPLRPRRRRPPGAGRLARRRRRRHLSGQGRRHPGRGLGRGRRSAARFERRRPLHRGRPIPGRRGDEWGGHPFRPRRTGPLPQPRGPGPRRQCDLLGRARRPQFGPAHRRRRRRSLQLARPSKRCPGQNAGHRSIQGLLSGLGRTQNDRHFAPFHLWRLV